MIVQFPKLLIFVERDGQQVDVARGFVSKGEMLMIKMGLRTREYEIGQRLMISAEDFEDIAFACSQFASELARTLPKVQDYLASPSKMT